MKKFKVKKQYFKVITTDDNDQYLMCFDNLEEALKEENSNNEPQEIFIAKPFSIGFHQLKTKAVKVKDPGLK